MSAHRNLRHSFKYGLAHVAFLMMETSDVQGADTASEAEEGPERDQGTEGGANRLAFPAGPTHAQVSYEAKCPQQACPQSTSSARGSRRRGEKDTQAQQEESCASQ